MDNQEKLTLLPPAAELESKPVMKQLARASRALAELKGYAAQMRDEQVLMNTITVRELHSWYGLAKVPADYETSGIELYRILIPGFDNSPAAKAMESYRTALWHGYELVRERNMLTFNMMANIHSIMAGHRAEIRKLPGERLIDPFTGECVHEPPDNRQDILDLVANLETYINDNADGTDPLIKAAVTSCQFTLIQPFYDSNARTSQVLTVLYLVLQQMLDSPLIYLTRYFNSHQEDYFAHLRGVCLNHDWEGWLIFFLAGIEEASLETLDLARKINLEVSTMTWQLKTRLPKLYSARLADLLFYDFYTRIRYIQAGLGVSRRTAATYLQALEEQGLLVSEKFGRDRIYLNRRLYELVR